ncbi:MAG: hypothetical protein DHS20C11_08980 [Lysobacteraceae bacterium]|nr:MAG: hypothetical protein DHS20C11_08980 [Xanthomonadaceae bacterium]
MNPINDAGQLLITFIFGFIVFLFLLRILLQLCRVDFRTPIAQFVATLTNPVTIPLSRLIPRVGRLDTPAALVLLIAKWLELILLWVTAGVTLNVGGAALWAVAEILDLTVTVFMFAIVIQIILSWVSPMGGDPLTSTLRQLTAPILVPLRNLIPPVGMFDLSPMVAILALLLTRTLITAPMVSAGAQLALGG